MTKASDNVFPRFLISEGGSTATPAAGQVTAYAKANGLLYSKDDAGAETALGGAATLTTVTQDLGADQATNNTSTWTDTTGLTGISVAAGIWIATLNVEHVCTANYGPVFRVWDGTTVYCQGGYIGNFLAAVSTHQCISSKPFTLGSTATMVVQYFTDTAFTINKYPTRGASATAVATNVTFVKIG